MSIHSNPFVGDLTHFADKKNHENNQDNKLQHLLTNQVKILKKDLGRMSLTPLL